jgi:hypothetical protein
MFITDSFSVSVVAIIVYIVSLFRGKIVLISF